MRSPPHPDKENLFIYFVGGECTFGQSWREWYPGWWRSTISRYAVARTPIHVGTICFIFAYFILITVLVSVFMFSLVGEEEDHDLVIAKGLGRIDQ